MQFQRPDQQRPTGAEYAQEWGKGINQFGNTLASNSDKRRQEMMADYLRKKQEGKDQLTMALEAGKSGFDFTPPGQTAPTIDAPMPQNGSQMPQVGPYSNPQPEGTPGTTTGGSYASPPSPLLSNQSPVVALHKKSLAQYKTGAGTLTERPRPDYGQTLTDMNSGNYGGYQNLDDKSRDDVEKIREFDLRSKELAQKQKESKDALDVRVGEKNDQFYQKEWDKIEKESNPLTTSGRSGLGMAAKADYNANRALVTLSKPVVTNQEAANVMADIAQIYQGGSPTEYGMSHQGYNSLYQRITGTMQYLTGQPQDSLPDAVKQRLLGVLKEMKTTNSAVIKQQLDHLERAQPQVINKFKDQWRGIRENMENGISGGPETTGLTWQGRTLKDTPANREWLKQQQGGSQ